MSSKFQPIKTENLDENASRRRSQNFMLEMEQEIKKRQSLTLTPLRDNTALNQNPILRQSDCSPNGMGGIFKKMINPDFSELDYKKRSLPASK